MKLIITEHNAGILSAKKVELYCDRCGHEVGVLCYICMEQKVLLCRECLIKDHKDRGIMGDEVDHILVDEVKVIE